MELITELITVFFAMGAILCTAMINLDTDSSLACICVSYNLACLENESCSGKLLSRQNSLPELHVTDLELSVCS